MAKQETFLLCPTMVARPLQNFVKILSVDFTICWWHLVASVLTVMKVKNLEISFSASIRCSQNLQEEMRDCRKSNIL